MSDKIPKFCNFHSSSKCYLFWTKNNYIHTDIKPEDFDLCIKIGINQDLHTYGITQYMVNEMIGECFYGVEIDNWPFGGSITI
jgi:hypothetical protein